MFVLEYLFSPSKRTNHNMMIRSMSGLDRSNSSCNYVVLPPGMPVVATTPVPQATNGPPVADNAIVTSGILSSVLVFFMWVGAWGAIDSLVQIATDNTLYQFGIYVAVFSIGAIALWLQVEDWKKSQDIGNRDSPL